MLKMARKKAMKDNVDGKDKMLESYYFWYVLELCLLFIIELYNNCLNAL